MRFTYRVPSSTPRTPFPSGRGAKSGTSVRMGSHRSIPPARRRAAPSPGGSASPCGYPVAVAAEGHAAAGQVRPACVLRTCVSYSCVQ